MTAAPGSLPGPAGAGDRATRVDRIREALQAALSPMALEVLDDSARHAGHEGAKDGRGHFNVAVTSDAFEGLGPLARHRAVYAALAPMLETDIHALSIRAQTPEEAARPGGQLAILAGKRRS